MNDMCPDGACCDSSRYVCEIKIFGEMKEFFNDVAEIRQCDHELYTKPVNWNRVTDKSRVNSLFAMIDKISDTKEDLFADLHRGELKGKIIFWNTHPNM